MWRRRWAFTPRSSRPARADTSATSRKPSHILHSSRRLAGSSSQRSWKATDWANRPADSRDREGCMNVDLARWQFAFVTINHFFFVPVTIGLAFLTALLQTAWYHSKREEYL